MGINQCDIRAENKLRNGYANWWCYTHFASARGEGGVKLDKCLKAEVSSISEDEKIFIDLDEYLGGVGIWGTLEAVFDTKRAISERGVHVHLRRKADLDKEVDKSFAEVYVKVPINTLFAKANWVKIDEEIACAYTASVVFNRNIKVVKCKYCGREHIDSDYFSVHYHKKHFCTFCGRDFLDTEHGISNPVSGLQEMFKDKLEDREIKKVDRVLKINQRDYPGGIQIWGSNPAIIWTAKRPEESGMHVHLFKEKTGAPYSDDTYGYVEIDGIELDDQMVRYFMVQQSFPYLIKYIASLECPKCNKEHFDTGDNAMNPHKVHICEHCGNVFKDGTRFKGVVSNPIKKRLEKLKENYKNLHNKKFE